MPRLKYTDMSTLRPEPNQSDQAVVTAPVLLSIPSTAQIYDCNGRTIYRKIAAGHLTAVKLGRATRVTAESIKADIARLPAFGSRHAA